MPTLHLRVPQEPGESPASFCSRLARRNHCPSTREFCLDMGFPFLHIVNGRRESLAKLAELGAVSLPSLMATAIRKSGSTYVCAGQTINRWTLGRDRIRVCPQCIVEDLECAPHLGDLAAFGRAAWLITPIRTCIKHAVELVQIVSPEWLSRNRNMRHDFAHLILPLLKDRASWLETAQRREPTGLECYLVDRIQGHFGTGSELLDRLPFYAAVRVCEIVGAVEVNGPGVVLDRLGSDQWREAGGAGFDILKRWPIAMDEMLDRLVASPASRSNISLRGHFGQLYEWFLSRVGDAAYDPIREFIHHKAIETLPLGPGDAIFGQPVMERRLHSIHSASIETGCHPKRLRKLLHQAGFIGDADVGQPTNRALFKANATAEAFLAKVRDAMSSKDTAQYVNAPRAQFALLMTSGLLVPFIKFGGGVRDLAFDKKDLDSFLDNLFRHATEKTAADDDLADIPTATHCALNRSMDVVKMVMEGRLTRIRRDPRIIGYMSILVDPEEIRRTVYPQKPGLSLKEVDSRVGWSCVVTAALVDLGLIPSQTIRNPITRMPQRIISPEDLEKFSRSYISLHVLAKERGQPFLKVKAAIKSAGVQPAFDPAQVHATFYARSELPDLP